MYRILERVTIFVKSSHVKLQNFFQEVAQLNNSASSVRVHALRLSAT